MNGSNLTRFLGYFILCLTGQKLAVHYMLLHWKFLSIEDRTCTSLLKALQNA